MENHRRLLFGVPACAAMLCILLTGAPRLIADNAQDIQPARWEHKEAVLCLGTSAETERTIQGGTTESGVQQSRLTALWQVLRMPKPRCAVAKDSNGNVLFARSYLREVYVAFSLGDGFV